MGDGFEWEEKGMTEGVLVKLLFFFHSFLFRVSRKKKKRSATIVFFVVENLERCLSKNIRI